MSRMNKNPLKRISSDLDKAINETAKKNNLRYTDASKELANMYKKMKGKKLQREIIF